jgi:glycosyltransferase involved in cell wall biosynthesis
VHREITAGGNAAALFRCGDSETLAQQLRQLLDSVDIRQHYSATARQLVERKYSVTGASRQYIETFGLA